MMNWRVKWTRRETTLNRLSILIMRIIFRPQGNRRATGDSVGEEDVIGGVRLELNSRSRYCRIQFVLWYSKWPLTVIEWIPLIDSRFENWFVNLQSVTISEFKASSNYPNSPIEFKLNFNALVNKFGE